MQQTYNYLALGDSYTIGESIRLIDSFPYQTVQMLRKKGYLFQAPEIIARTGWTTDELEEGMKKAYLLPKYNFVSLLVGVNNQYRGRTVEEYKSDYENILKKVLELSTDKSHIFLISIPDYSVTPFSKNLDKEKISKELELFNSISKVLSIQYKVQYIDITIDSRNSLHDRSLIAHDNLHPSAKEYENWAQKLASAIGLELK